MKPQVEQDLAHVLLTEILAYQFASPVRWIETQDVILKNYQAERIVEIGPSPTLAGMAKRTLTAYQANDAALSLQRQILSYAKDAKEIYYDIDQDATPAHSESQQPVSAQPTQAAASAVPETQTTIPAAAKTAVTAAPAAPASPAGPAANIDDVPLRPIQVLQALVAQKVKKSLADVPVTKAIRDLVGGKSTVQNEILGDLAKEFNVNPEKAEEVPLVELAAQLGDNFDGKLGKHTTSLISRAAALKMPGGFGLSAIRKYLQTRWGLGAGRQDAVLLFAITQEPASRLASEADAHKYWDEISQLYAKAENLNLSQTRAAESGSGGGAVAIDPAELEKITGDQKQLVRQQLELLARYLKIDLRDGQKRFVAQKEATEVLQQELDLWIAEHGDVYAQGIVPIFSPLKARIYDSYWNWARQDCFKMFYDIIWGRLNNVDREIVSRCIAIMNRANPTLIDVMLYYIDNVPTERGPTFKLAKELANQLMINCKEALDNAPVYKDVARPTGPYTTVTAKGQIQYEEACRLECRKLEQYVLDMAHGNELCRDRNNSMAYLEKIYASLPRDEEVEKALALLKSKLQIRELPAKGMRPDIVPFLHLKKQEATNWIYSPELTGVYLNGLERAARDGISFANKNVLLTGAGKNSIGTKVLEGLLMGGAKVVVTTSRFSKETTDYYQSIYTRLGSTGSALVVVPFNQASQTDLKALVDYIYDEKTGLGWDLDFVIPFAAIPEGGMEIDGIESKSELAHRLMLTNLIRLLGLVKSHKVEKHAETRPAQVLLPMSPNHGTFGGDGLYSESKIALETLFNRWHSESWANYLTICGAIIGWTRGTGLMSQNDLVAEGIERLGVRTFSPQEMAFNLLGLMTAEMVDLCQKSPLWADLNGGMQDVPDLKERLAQLRTELFDSAELRRAVAVEAGIDHKVVNGPTADLPYQKRYVKPRSNLKFEIPKLKNYDELPANDVLGDMLDLERVVVVTGFAEVGPWGNSRTRWEMEAFGKFSLEGVIEMAWIMGLVKYHNGPLKGTIYTGWVDAKTGTPVEETDIKSKYEEHILSHSGIRLIEPDLLEFDPKRKQLLQEVIIEHDLEPFEASKEAAAQFRLEQGDKVEVFSISNSDQYSVRFLKGARIMIPKAIQFTRLVAGQIPTGWDARRYGIPQDIISQVDQVSLFNLVSTVEALLSAGITDPYEFYRYVHVSEVGNATGSGMGGMAALQKIFKNRFVDEDVQSDILQESFINTIAAWVNMLLLSSSGPIKTPVGACATAVESVDSGVELIRSGKARVVFVGGADDLREEGIQEFANMNATSNSVTEMEHGRTPREMSRPATTTRSGFMEAHGSGVQVLMDAQLAIDMGVPVYGIVALTATATDKTGRSVPAPGQGIMTVAREVPRDNYRLLDISYRRRQLNLRRKQISEWAQEETKSVSDPAIVEEIACDVRRQEKEAMATWSNDFYLHDPHISPLRGALATWGLTIDDIGIASFHGTSTKANDKNESEAIHMMLKHLGRSRGNPILGIFQKYLTGHPKGAAGAWMLNGVLQSINSGIVPGNRNADNIDKALEQYDMIVYPSVSLQTYGIKAGILTSFGFGQKGAFALIIHPDYLYSVLSRENYETYRKKVANRYDKVYRYLHDAICNNTMFRAKDHAPYTTEQEHDVYMNPLARTDKSLKYPEDLNLAESDVRRMISSISDSETVGVDVELISSINIENQEFLNRNFTDAEQNYCKASPDPRASFTGTWAAKEAVFKSLNTVSRGGGAPLIDIEILRDATGPKVVLHKDAALVAKDRSVKVSISHNSVQAVAVATCK